MADDVRLTDLGLIQRYSIAVRGETADRAELLATLRADLDWLQGSGSKTTRAAAAKPATRTSTRSAAKAAKPAKPVRRAR